MLETIRATIDAIDEEGRGVGRAADGAEVSMPGVLPGETVFGQVVHRSKKNRVFATPVAIETRAPSRVESRCVHFLDCGGCDFLHADRTFQLEFKRNLVAEALKKPVEP